MKKDTRTPEQILADLKARAARQADNDGYRIINDDEQVELRDDAKRIRDEFLKLRADHRATTVVDDDGKITYQDETEYLLSSPTNAERLYRSIDQCIAGETFERPLFELHDDGSITLDGEEIETTDVTHMTKEEFIEFLREEDGE